MTSSFVENLHGEAAFQGFAVSAELLDKQTNFQHMKIVANERFGRVLILDGIVQTTENDEFMYHEMLVHVPMFACANPKRILIVGGGDGGSLREVLKHDIEHVDMVEIDEQVVVSCIEHLPSLNHGGRIYDDPRARLVIADAFEYLRDVAEGYDVIISDSTDPVGAGEILFSEQFYRLLQQQLRLGGTMALQDGVVFLQPDEPRETIARLRGLGLAANCYTTVVPTYYGGFMTLAFATNDPSLRHADPTTIQARWQQRPVETRCYTPQHHVASFSLPKWVDNIVEGKS